MRNQNPVFPPVNHPDELFEKACRYGLHQTDLLFPVKDFTLKKEKADLPRWPYGRDQSFRHEMKDLTYEDTDLERLFHPGIFLKDKDHDGFSDFMDFKVYLQDEKDPWALYSAANLLCRFAMDCTCMPSFPVYTEKKEKGNLIVFENTEKPKITLEGKDGYARLHIFGRGEELYQFIALFCNEFDDYRNGLPLDEITWRLRNAFEGKTYDGQTAYVHSFLKGSGPFYLDYPEAIDFDYGLIEYNVHDRRTPVEVFREEEEGYSETEELLQKLQDAKIQDHSGLVIEAAVSKSTETRKKLEKEIREQYPHAEVHVYNAYKQGFSWIEEKCMPALKKQEADKITIFFKPDIKEGETQWVDEDGAVPIRTAAAGKDETRWMELGIRFLQELYPIDDILAEGLGIGRDSIRFQPLEPGSRDTYIIRGYHEDELVYEDRYFVPVKERYYLDDYPSLGLVHPEKAYLKIYENKKILVDQVFDTDRDWIWNLFQAKTLPAVQGFVLKKGKNLKEQQPFFSRLSFKIGIDDTERRLPCRNDMISTIDALQEDLYFTTLAWFKQLGIAQEGKPLDAPGLIMPDISVRSGAPSYTVVLEEPKYPYAVDMRSGSPKRIDASEGKRLHLSAIEETEGMLDYKYDTYGEDNFSFLYAFGNMLLNGQLDLSGCVRGMGYLSFDDVQCNTKSMPPISKRKKIENVKVPEKKPITYQKYFDIIDQLKHVKGLQVIQIAESFYGRRIYAVTFDHKKKGYHSLTHELTYRPCVLINCRHHANEVSSTTSAFLLIKKLLMDPELKDIPEKMRLFIIPMENPDGAYAHEELSMDHPYNKLHMARFDGTGNEFAHEMFVQNTMHTEAHGIYCLFRAYYPDLIIDDHGVPTHEWDQPYSGYVSPDYRGFWLPRSILYGYFWNASDPQYQHNQDLCHAIADAVADEMEKHPEMVEWNREWQDRFEKYAHAYMPKMFPADYYRGMINYWIDRKQDDRNMYLSQRWPWVTTCYYTSEVADETAQGDYLKLCAETHLYEDLAVLKVMQECRLTYEDTDNGIIRHRPVLPGIHKEGEE